MHNKQDVLSYLASLQLRGIDLQLNRMRDMMEALGNPQETYKTLHVAGTNGKGSTAAFLSSMYGQEYKTGLYTSPFLIDFNERIQVDGQEISDEELVKTMNEIKEKTEHLHPTRFEAMTAAAFLYFKGRVDVAIIEVGLGGKFDATNIITPLGAAITNISLDHQEMLGTTKEKIAHEKAGIIKENIPVVTAEKEEDILAIFKTYTKSLKEVERAKVISSTLEEQQFLWKGTSYLIHLAGLHQIENACTALALVEAVQEDLPLKEESKQKGLRKAVWPGRIQVINKQPLVVLDGAHNIRGCEVLRETVKNIPRQKVLVLGIKRGKEVGKMCDILTSFANEVIVTEGNFEPFPAKEVAKHIKKPVSVTTNPLQAFIHAKEQAGKEGMVVVAGSLYLVGDILKATTKHK